MSESLLTSIADLEEKEQRICPKIILEGTRLTLKTEIAFGLNEHPLIVGKRKYRYHNPIISAEWPGFSNTAEGRGLINFLPVEEDRAMETYRTWLRMFELQRYYSWIVDRFHLSTRAYHLMTNEKDYDFLWLEERLKPLNFRIVFCTRSPESFAEAREERIKISGKPSQYDDLTLFIKEQTLFRRIADESILPVYEVDISDNDVPRAIDDIAIWLERNGGLYMEG